LFDSSFPACAGLQVALSLNVGGEGGKTGGEHRILNIQHRTSKLERGIHFSARPSPRVEEERECRFPTE
jgi:hypothetical protein